ncbi:MAG TPA: HD domain-containing phosphohydrolase [Solirubrobacteraceae bacterium]|nr:HD domain-containing phosphohydrolase [Solirubrobacteraceae bacterium]
MWWLRAAGAISSAILCVPLGMGLSLCASQLGCALWEKRPGSEDLLFSELMIWGYLHRLRAQHRLASALDTLGPMSETQSREVDGMSTKERAKLLERLVAGIETRDPHLHGHSRRVARHAWMIARRMGLPRADVARIRTAAAIHDVGKIKTPQAILRKAGPLTDEEYEVIKRHPGDGALMAATLRDLELTAMVEHHHERLDGTGYPDGLSGEDIPLGARIIAVADTFDAITSERPYRPASPHKQAIDILRDEAGTRLDPAVVRAFRGHYAGRRPLAFWTFLAGLPERVVSWLGGSAASVASTAKVAAVAAFVGGAAMTSSMFGLPVAKHHSAKATAGSTIGPRAQIAGLVPVRAPAASAAVTGGSRRSRGVPHAAVVPVARDGAPAGAGALARPSVPHTVATVPRTVATVPGQRAEPGGRAWVVVVKSEDPNEGKAEASLAPGNIGSPSKGSGEAAPTKSEEAKAKGEEAKAKSEEAPATSEASAGSGTGKAGPGTSEEAQAASKAADGTVKAVVKEVAKEVVEHVHGTVAEVTGKTTEVLGKLR